MIGSPSLAISQLRGILLRRLEINPDLEGTTHVVVDEVHERSIEIDICLLALRDLAKRRSDLKIILVSATTDTNLLSSYFDGACRFVISGISFPVQEFFLEDALRITKHVVNQSAVWASESDSASPGERSRRELQTLLVED